MQENKKIFIGKKEILPLARKMRQAGVPLTMIHGYIDEKDGPVISYEYAQGELVESYEVRGENELPSIEPVYDMAAQWPERELHELIGVVFTGSDTSKRLFLPDNLLEGEGQILVTPLDELRRANVDARTDGKK